MALADFVRNAGKVRGWHWSGMRTRMGDLGWSYTKVLRQNIDPSDRVLDVGTGGGEVFSGVARPQDTALDFKMEMLQVARENLPCHLVAGDHRALPFDTGSFDVVADRHVGADAREVLRVLRPGGRYVTQRPGDRICQNIFDAFGWGRTATSGGARRLRLAIPTGTSPPRPGFRGSGVRDRSAGVGRRGLRVPE